MFIKRLMRLISTSDWRGLNNHLSQSNVRNELARTVNFAFIMLGILILLWVWISVS